VHSNRLSSGAALLIAAVFATTTASATVLFDNPPDLSSTQDGSCLYDTTCEPHWYAAEAFSLTGAATVTSVDFNSIVLGNGATGSAANYQFLLADGPGGLPRTLVASGLGEPITATNGPTGTSFPTIEYSFGVTSFNLLPGTYYVAIQLVSTNASDYLSAGVATSGAAQSTDGGLTYSAGYGVFRTIAVSVEGTRIAEPASLALLGVGLLGTLAFARRRTR
jgi:PEP-CTERM motif